jgi:hypothetical protein
MSGTLEVIIPVMGPIALECGVYDLNIAYELAKSRKPPGKPLILGLDKNR